MRTNLKRKASGNMPKHKKKPPNRVQDQKKVMRPSALAFAENQCAKNRARMEREDNGDFGTPIHIIP